MEINIKPHTLVYTVAPSGSGKTFFAKEVLVKQIKEKYPELNVQYLGSDDIRQDLLGLDEVDFHDNRMQEVSQSAFKVLELKLESLMQYDIRAEIIIVDTTGLNKTFREYLDKVTKDNAYHIMPILFDYKDRGDYLDFNTSNKITSAQLKRFRQDVISNISVKKYPQRLKISERKTPDMYTINVDGYERYREHFLPEKNEYVIVSDIHGCLDPLIELIALEKDTTVENGLINSKNIFIVQDYIDKGNQILEVIEFLHTNFKIGRVLPLMGNHENFVYKALTDKLPDFKEKFLEGELRPLLDEMFNTYALLTDVENAKYKEMFIELCENSKSWYSHPTFFVNHAPCLPKFLGKVDSHSLREQRNYIYERRVSEKIIGDDGVETDVFKDSEEEFSARVQKGIDKIIDLYNNRHYRNVVWGHVAIDKVYRRNGVVMIDTACVGGGKLTSVNFDWLGKPYTKEVLSTLPKKEGVLKFKNAEKKITFDELDHKEVRRIKFMAKDKVNFIMGTMTPSDKDENDPLNTLESLIDGLSYFKSRGVGKVMLQKKYMGSNSQIYLFKDVEKSYATSRNGYLIKIDLSDAFAKLHNRMLPYMEANGYDMLLISAELMPWSVLGRGLIDFQFSNVYKGFASEIELLKENNFYELYNDVINNPLKEEFIADTKKMSKNDQNKKYGQQTYSLLKNIQEIEEIIAPYEVEKQGAENFKRQLDLFGSDGDPYFLPFSILKAVKNNGDEKLFLNDRNEDLFKIVSDDEYLIIDFSDNKFLDKALEFYRNVCDVEGMEGVVIKPEIVDTFGVLPFMKVRNKKYLTLTYGYDYEKEHKFKKLFNRKYIKSKQRASMKQWNISKKMLEVPYNEISMDNSEYVSASIDMVIEERFVEKLDPRL